MASLATSLSFSLQHRLVSGVTHTNPPTSTSTSTAVHLSAFAKTKIKITKLTLTSSSSIFFNHSLLSFSSFPASSPVSKPFSLFVVSAKGYKMKTHKASAKRFRVTGTGKIMRRRAGKQHLLRKKNTKRRVRLSKMLQVNRSDYNNVIGALPYLKVNRQN